MKIRGSGRRLPPVLLPVSFRARLEHRAGAEPVYAGVGPEIDDDDLAARGVWCEWRRVEPLGRTLKRSDLGLC